MYDLHKYSTHASGQSRVTGAYLPLVALVLLACATSQACAQDTAKALSDAQLSSEERRQAALQWLDQYVSESQLMRQDDVAKIRDAVARMSPSQLDQWLKQTAELRAFVESPAWQETKRWMREYLRVQAVYSDKEIQQLHDDIFHADADQMLAILQRIQAKHDSLVWMHQASQQSRAAELQSRNARVAQEAAAASKARSKSSANVPLFGSGFATGQKQSKGYQVPGPLITSREVARAVVWSEAWGGAGW